MISTDRVIGWLESHVNLETMESGRYRTPTLERMRELCMLMGDPQLAYPAIHITGTNGKGSVARMVSDLLSETGLTVGTYTSPDLESIRERLSIGGEPVDEATFTELLGDLEMLESMTSELPSRFEILTAAAFRWFADAPVDVAVVEVGLGGRWDATNLVDTRVAVVTNVALDHTDLLGPTRADIAAEKAGIVKPGSLLVLGVNDPDLEPVFQRAVDEAGATVWRRDEDFACLRNDMAVGGRLVDLRVPSGDYSDIVVPLHGRHQGENAAAALAAVDAFFGTRLGDDLVAQAFASVRVPGRLEVVSRDPLVVIDGAHNPAGADCAGEALSEEFPAPPSRTVVMGLLTGRDPGEMIDALGVEDIARVIACPAPSPRSQEPGEIVAAARLRGIEALAAPSVSEALVRAMAESTKGEMILVTGSMYVVGAARTEARVLLSPS